MAAERELYKSHSEFSRAKHLHRTDVSAARQPPPAASPPRMREHPCARSAAGPEHREWKFASAHYVDPREAVTSAGLHSSQRDLSIRKYTHVHVIPPRGPAGPAKDRHPQEFRHQSQYELAGEVKLNKTPLYPVQAASPQSREPASPAPRSVRSGESEVRDSTLDASGRPTWSQKRLEYEKAKHVRSHGASARSVSGPPPSDAIPAGSPTNAYYKRLERARALRESVSPAREFEYGTIPSRHASPSRRARVPAPTADVGIALAHGRHYPSAPNTVGPQERNAQEFQHYSQAQMRDEKEVSATLIHPPPKSPSPALGIDAPVVSQQTFANQKRRHNRTHAHSPSASPARSLGAYPAASPGRVSSRGSPSPARSPSHQPPPAPPSYVGIRPAGGAANLAASRLSLSPGQTA